MMRYRNDSLAVLQEPCKIAIFDETGQGIKQNEKLVRKSAASASQ